MVLSKQPWYRGALTNQPALAPNKGLARQNTAFLICARVAEAQERGGKVSATDVVPIYIHVPEPEATPIWDRLPAGGHEQRFNAVFRF